MTQEQTGRRRTDRARNLGSGVKSQEGLVRFRQTEVVLPDFGAPVSRLPPNLSFVIFHLSFLIPLMRPVIFDTDIGTDVVDILSLILLAKAPELHLICVTTFYANTLLRARIA